MNWYLEAIRNYTNFSGRARRKEYWMFILFNIIFSIVAALIDRMLGTTYMGGVYGTVYTLYSLFVFLPSWAVTIRRLHDIGKSGWMILINLIPLIGAIWFLVLLVKDTEPGDNIYGPNPKYASHSIH